MSRRRTAGAIGMLAFAAAACASGPPSPATLDTKNDACAHCRMAVSDPRFAAQIVAPSEEPRFFDDIGCLRAYLREHPSASRDQVAYVADHRTAEWVLAADAVFTMASGIQTPMATGLIAHRDVASRDRDPASRGGTPVPAAEILGASNPRVSR
jgi:copper chaperone NosL